MRALSEFLHRTLGGDLQADGVLSPNMVKIPCGTATRTVLTSYLSPGYR